MAHRRKPPAISPPALTLVGLAPLLLMIALVLAGIVWTARPAPVAPQGATPKSGPRQPDTPEAERTDQLERDVKALSKRLHAVDSRVRKLESGGVSAWWK